MKTHIIICLIALATFAASAQSSWERMGFVIGRRETPAQTAHAAELKRQAIQQGNIRACGPTAFREINGATNNCLLSTNWVTVPNQYCRLKVVKEFDGMVFCDVVSARFDGHGDDSVGNLLITNYPHADQIVTDHYLSAVRATKVRRQKTTIGTFEVYDCGRPVFLPHSEPVVAVKP